MHDAHSLQRKITWYTPVLAVVAMVLVKHPAAKELAGIDLATLAEILFWAFLALSAGAAALAWQGREGAHGIASGLALAAGVGLLAAIGLRIGRPPLSGAYESISLISVVLAFLVWRARGDRLGGLSLPAVGWTAVAAMMSLLIWVPRVVNPDWFVYQFAWSRAFFLCRGTAMAFLLFSALATLAWPKEPGDLRRLLLERSRRTLLWGTALFLVGEVCGFYWCLSWRGDYWLWNRNFLESTMIFILASAALHLPPALAARPRVVRAIYSVPGLLATGAYLVHQVTEAFLS